MGNNPPCAFSVKYDDPFFNTRMWAADWDHWCPRRWAMSWSLGSAIWHPVRDFNGRAYKAVLKKFGLEKWAKDFPREKVETMSPAELIAERRKREAEYRLPALEVTTDNIIWKAGTGKEKYYAEQYP